MPTDLSIAQNTKALPIDEVAKKLNLTKDDLILYGTNKAKIRGESKSLSGKLVLVSAMTPTPHGEGKTTCSVGLCDGLARVGKRCAVALREPSMGPVFGMKGGAAGGGYSQVIPMEDINLHFTGDIHAVSAANNLIAALIDNHIQQGNELQLDSRRITWKRALDLNDRQLRNVIIGLGGKANGVPRESGFDISVASEIMAILCLADSLADLKSRIAQIVIGQNCAGDFVQLKDLGIQGAATALLKDAMLPNLVQTLEHNPAIIHGGPFANIAHGCNSIAATKRALSNAEIVVTEAGFGADLGAEKFINIKSRVLGRFPDAIVLVVTLRAILYHAGAKETSPEAIRLGFENVKRHIQNIRDHWKIPAVVAINVFETDAKEDLERIQNLCREEGVDCQVCESWAKGGAGAVELAKAVLNACETPKSPRHSYDLSQSLCSKIESIAKNVYGAKGVNFAPSVSRDLKKFEESGYGKLPVCIAKTQYSFSDNPKLLAAAQDFEIEIKSVKLSAGAGFVVALAGDIMTMPGLPKKPAAYEINIDEDGIISSLF